MRIRYADFTVMCALLAGSVGEVDGQDQVNLVVAREADRFCSEVRVLPIEVCRELVRASIDSMQSGDADTQGVEDVVNAYLAQNPTLQNTALADAFGELPLALELKALDGEEDSTVLGIGFSYHRPLRRVTLDPTAAWRRTLNFNLSAEGTIVSDADSNPRDFLNTHLALLTSFSTKIPPQQPDFGKRLTEYEAMAEQCLASAVNSAACKTAASTADAMFESVADFVGGFQQIQIGIDAGYEAGQSLDAKQSRLGAFARWQYESWTKRTLIGALGVTPTVRIGLDSVAPGSETPRAQAGDDSTYRRLTGEFSLWMPLDSVNGSPLAITFNHRQYRELDPAAVTSAANLARYRLNTWSIAGTKGFFLSYSSGRLPFDLENTSTVELGWKTYF